MSKYSMLHHPLSNLRTAFGLVFLTMIAFVGGLMLAPYLSRVTLLAQIAPMTTLTEQPALPPRSPKAGD